MLAIALTLFAWGIIVIFIYAVSTAENAAFSLSADEVRALATREESGAGWLSDRLKKPRELIQYFVILKTFLSALLFALGLTFYILVPGWPSIVACGVLFWVVLLMFANAFPGKAIRGDRIRKALQWLPFVRFLGLILTPLVVLWRALINILVPEGGIGGPLAIERVLDELMPEGEDFTSLETDEKEMIRHVMEFRNTTVREIMVPRIDMVCISADASPQEAVKVITEAGHTRVPIYEGRIDNVAGVLYAKDLLLAISGENSVKSLIDIAREPYFVPESKLVSDLLRELKRKRIHMAIIVDEYGGTAGLVTLEDLIEEIIGEIQDEYDFEEVSIRKLKENVYNVEAKVPIDEVNDQLGIELPEDESETLGGFIYSLAGAIPNAGDRFEFENLLFIVESVSGQRLKNVKIIIRDKDEED